MHGAIAIKIHGENLLRGFSDGSLPRSRDEGHADIGIKKEILCHF